MLYLVYQPYTANWWASSCYGRSTISCVFASLGTFYATSLLIKIVAQNNGCGDPFFINTRSRCHAQYAISAAEYFWSLLIIVELIIATTQMRDDKWHQERAEQQLQNTVVYNPDLSLERPIRHETVQMTDLSNSAPTPNGHDTEELPVYAHEAPMNQRRIVDMTYLPAAAGPRQEPETTAIASLDAQGSSLNNLPPPPTYKP
ncbi:hypothetical protein BGZ51_004414 [Haplosporangium sp. Z 767]|nr:hypothetical protein BGZ50_005502 [Haplosporangium sp. Z 11]KAF9192959.1 hypothetical protein BGZ51_004414 [Haplosporangium sp. Z 767]